MQKIIFVIFSFLLLNACSIKQDDELIINREVEVFSSQNFLRFNPDWNGEDMILNEDGSLTLVGNTRTFQPGLSVQPFMFNLDAQKNIDWTNFFNLDQRNIYRRVKLIPTENQGFMALTYSDPAGNGDFRMNFIKVSSNGFTNWKEEFNQEDFVEQISSIIQVGNGDYIALSKLSTTQGLYDNQMLLFRMSYDREIIWTKVIDANFITFTKEIYYVPSDNSFIALTEHTLETPIGFELKLHKFNEQGDKIWTKSIIRSEEDLTIAESLLSVFEDQIFLSFSLNENADRHNPNIVLQKLDLDANIIWENTYQGIETDLSEDLIKLADGNLALLSSTTSFGNGRFDLMLTKVNASNGDIIWDKVYGSPYSDFGRKIVVRPNGNIVVMGSTNHDNPSDARYDLFILETDSEGNPI